MRRNDKWKCFLEILLCLRLMPCCLSLCLFPFVLRLFCSGTIGFCPRDFLFPLRPLACGRMVLVFLCRICFRLSLVVTCGWGSKFCRPKQQCTDGREGVWNCHVVCGVCAPQLLQEYSTHLEKAQPCLRLRFKGEAPVLEERVANCLKRVKRYFNSTHIGKHQIMSLPYNGN